MTSTTYLPLLHSLTTCKTSKWWVLWNHFVCFDFYSSTPLVWNGWVSWMVSMATFVWSLSYMLLLAFSGIDVSHDDLSSLISGRNEVANYLSDLYVWHSSRVDISLNFLLIISVMGSSCISVHAIVSHTFSCFWPIIKYLQPQRAGYARRQVCLSKLYDIAQVSVASLCRGGWHSNNKQGWFSFHRGT